MATPASERLSKLLAKAGLPNRLNEEGTSNIQREPSIKNNAEEKPVTVPEVARHSQATSYTPSFQSHIADQSSTDEEDEYEALFLQKPEMKAPKGKKSKNREKPKAGVFGYPEDIEARPLAPSTYLPNRKSSPGPPGNDKLLKYNADSSQPLPKYDKFGHKATGHFCVLSLVAKFPYKYMDDRNDRVSRHFFADNKFYSRDWDLYCLQPPAASNISPILLLPYHQVKQLMDEIGTAFKTEVRVPNDPFSISFFDDGTPQPIYLGTSRSRDDVAKMQTEMPPAPQDHGVCPLDATDEVAQSFTFWQAKIERVHAATKKKSTAAKKTKAALRFNTIKNAASALRRAQRCLGLRPLQTVIPEPIPFMTRGEQQRHGEKQAKNNSQPHEKFDVNLPACHQFENEAILISVDVEAYERDHGIITEVGVSTLDTLDLVNIAPGPSGSNWIRKIRSRHFRIKEFAHLINKDFCVGDPDGFLYGQSEFVSLAEAPAAVESCFREPFSARRKQGDATLQTGSNNNHENGTSSRTLGNSEANTRFDEETSRHEKEKPRKWILVGHDLDGDIAYLRKLHCDIFASMEPTPLTYPLQPSAKPAILANWLGTLDTTMLYRVLARENQSRNLGSVMYELGFDDCRGLHNAGNDARYTMEALIAMAVRARQDADIEHARKQNGVDPAWEKEKARRVKETYERVKGSVEEEFLMWESTSADESMPLGSNTATKLEMTEDVKPEDVKPEDVKTEDVKTEDIKTEDVKTEDVKTEDVKTEAVKTGLLVVAQLANRVAETGEANSGQGDGAKWWREIEFSVDEAAALSRWDGDTRTDSEESSGSEHHKGKGKRKWGAKVTALKAADSDNVTHHGDPATEMLAEQISTLKTDEVKGLDRV